ncbi:MAG: hypothetical protein ACTTH0_02395, partial [Eubacteriales bacterium]
IKAGIPATYVTGYIDDGKSRERHAWNLIQHGNDYAWIDTTWGDHPEVYTKEEAKYQYLHTYDYLYATDDILRSTHTVGTYVENIFAETEYKNLAKVWNFPNCTNENLYYYKKVGGYFDTYSKAGIEALFSKYVKEKNFSKMVFKFKNKKAYDAAYKDPYEFFDYLVSKYISQKGNKPVEYELWGSDESRVFTIKFKNKVNAK